MRATFSCSVLAILVWLPGTSLAQTPVKPGPEHDHFKQYVGAWDAVVKMPQGPKLPAIESKGTMIYKLDHGGLWLVSDFRAAEFSGQGATTYNAAKKKYVGSWIDSMSTSVLNTEGAVDKSGKILTETGETVGEDGKPMKVKMTTEFKDKDTQVFTFFVVADGKDQPMMSIDFNRKK